MFLWCWWRNSLKHLTYVAKKSTTIGFLLFRTRSSKSSTLWTVKIFCKFVVVEMCRWARNCPIDGITTDVANRRPINRGSIVTFLIWLFVAKCYCDVNESNILYLLNGFKWMDGSYDLNCASIKHKQSLFFTIWHTIVIWKGKNWLVQNFDGVNRISNIRCRCRRL